MVVKSRLRGNSILKVRLCGVEYFEEIVAMSLSGVGLRREMYGWVWCLSGSG